MTKGKNDFYYVLDNVDGELLKRFFVAIIWRASISQSDFYRHVSLGKFEERAREIVWGDHFRSPAEFAFTVTRYRESKFGEIIANPERIKVEGFNFIRLTLPHYVVHIKVDSRPGHDELLGLQISGVGKLYMGARDFRGSWEYSNYRRVLVE